MPTPMRSCIAQAVAGGHVAEVSRRRRAAAVRGGTRETLEDWTARLRKETRRRVPGEGDGVSRRHGRARTLRPAVSPVLRYDDPAHPVCGERDKLLPVLPDWRPSAGRSRLVAAAPGRLASDAGSAGGYEAEVRLAGPGVLLPSSEPGLGSANSPAAIRGSEAHRPPRCCRHLSRVSVRNAGGDEAEVKTRRSLARSCRLLSPVGIGRRRRRCGRKTSRFWRAAFLSRASV